MADGDGRFFFSELPPGEYYLEANKDGYVRGTYGQRHAGRPRAIYVTLRADFERRAGVTLRLRNYGAIGGTVVDEAGEPVPVSRCVRSSRNVVVGRPGVSAGSRSITESLLACLRTIAACSGWRSSRPAAMSSWCRPRMFISAVAEYSGNSRMPACERSSFWGGHRRNVAARTAADGPDGPFRAHDRLTGSSSLPLPRPSGGMTEYPHHLLSGSVYGRCHGDGSDGQRRGSSVPVLRMLCAPCRPCVSLGASSAPTGSVPPPLTIHLVGRSMNDVTTCRDRLNGPDHVALRDGDGIDRRDRTLLAARRSRRRMRAQARKHGTSLGFCAI